MSEDFLELRVSKPYSKLVKDGELEAGKLYLHLDKEIRPKTYKTLRAIPLAERTTATTFLRGQKKKYHNPESNHFKKILEKSKHKSHSVWKGNYITNEFLLWIPDIKDYATVGFSTIYAGAKCSNLLRFDYGKIIKLTTKEMFIPPLEYTTYLFDIKNCKSARMKSCRLPDKISMTETINKFKSTL